MARTALHDNVLDALGHRIVSGDLAPGAVITLDSVDSGYDVSRSVSREAVRVLESMGMVASRRRVGVTVQPRTSWHVFDPRLIRWRLASADRAAQLTSLGELRSGFEPVAAGLAALRATPEQCGVLTSAASDMVVHGRSGDLEAFLAADVAFHRVLLEASGNEMLAALGDVVAEVLAGRTHHHLMPVHPKDEAVDLHVEVARAVRSRDEGAARAAMAAIIAEATGAVAADAGDSTTLGDDGDHA
ncbi:FadR/GntR family transcriptional regulator [Nocardioides sp. Root190]|uniref:FadR/GntR family transcriptional regulator n=1 Tax=Nocardioides sp. Root190 TaxID=1736488 RepID=UPI000ADF2C76|nr:FCD domain-containing protein [Nocardioides sp. Root190]